MFSIASETFLSEFLFLFTFFLTDFQPQCFGRFFVFLVSFDNFLFLCDNHPFDEFQIGFQITVPEGDIAENILEFFMGGKIF